MNLGGKTLDELRAEFVADGNALSVLAEKRREYAVEIKRRVEAAGAKAKISLMDQNEKDALMAALKGEDPLQSKTEPVKK